MPHLKLNNATSELVPGRLGALDTVRQWKALAQYAEYNDQKLFYVDSGEGEVVLCLQGFPLASWSWGRVWPRLSHQYRMLSFDYLGSGYSDKPENYPHSVGDIADQVRYLLTTLHLKKVHILAHGSGVTVAQELLARQSEAGTFNPVQIQSVIFLNGGILPGFKSSFMNDLQRMLGNKPKMEGADEVLFGRLLNYLCDENSHLSAQFIHESWFLLNRKSEIPNALGLMSYLADREKNAGRWESVFENRDIPISCIIGQSDPVWGRKMTPALMVKVGREHVARLHEVGNFPHIESPSQVIKRVREILS